MAKLLLVDDDPKINNIVGRYLKHADHDVVAAFDCRQAERELSTQGFDLVIFDVMLPDGNGFQLLEELRAGSYFLQQQATPMDAPAIMLTALGETQNVIKGLKNGADDYMTKPFEPAELVQRVAAILRRVGSKEDASQELCLGDLRIDPKSRQIYVHAAPLDLQRREADLLFFFCRNPNQAFSREELLNKVWGWDYQGSDRAVDICVQRLRSKLKAADSHIAIRTVWGTGYRLDEGNEGK